MVNPFDKAVMAFVQGRCHNAVTDAVFPFVTYLGEDGIFWIALGLLLMLLGKRRGADGPPGWRSTGAVMLAAMLCGLIIGEVMLKNIVCRPRPFQTYPEGMPALIPPPSGFSFPSGHSCASFAAAAAIFCRDRRWGTAALALAGLIAFSRVFLFVHWPTDVLAGAALGLACGYACSRAYRGLARRGREGRGLPGRHTKRR